MEPSPQEAEPHHHRSPTWRNTEQPHQALVLVAVADLPFTLCWVLGKQWARSSLELSATYCWAWSRKGLAGPGEMQRSKLSTEEWGLGQIQEGEEAIETQNEQEPRAWLRTYRSARCRVLSSSILLPQNSKSCGRKGTQRGAFPVLFHRVVWAARLLSHVLTWKHRQ